MLNFRKLKQDFSSAIVKEGREFFEKQKVVSAKLIHLDHKTLRISGRVIGQYDNIYESEIEIDRIECETIDSNCDCPYNYDCQHIAALLFYLEQNLDQILVAYSKETDLEELAVKSDLDDEEKEKLLEKFEVARSKEVLRQEENFQRQVLQEYVSASEILATCPFFRADEKKDLDKAEFSLIFALPKDEKASVEIQLALRLPFRSKPLHVPNSKRFIEALRNQESIFMGGKKYCFGLDSFDQSQREVVRMTMDHLRFPENVASEKALRIGYMSPEFFGMILARSFELAEQEISKNGYGAHDEELPIIPGLYEVSLESPLRFSSAPAHFRFFLEYIPPPSSKILLNPFRSCDIGKLF